jgi:hypothetical protein
VLDVATFIVVTVSKIEFAHELKEGGPTVYSYLLLLAVERMLEQPRLPLD